MIFYLYNFSVFLIIFISLNMEVELRESRIGLGIEVCRVGKVGRNLRR